MANGANFKNLFMHLTNYSINKHSAHFVNNTDASTDDHGNKWSLSALRRCLKRNGVDVRARSAPGLTHTCMHMHAYACICMDAWMDTRTHASMHGHMHA